MDKFKQVRAYIKALKKVKALQDSGLAANLSQVTFTCYALVMKNTKGKAVTLCSHLRAAREAGLIEVAECEAPGSKRGVRPRAYRLTDAYLFCETGLRWLAYFKALANSRAYLIAWALFGEELTLKELSEKTGINKPTAAQRLRSLSSIVTREGDIYRLKDAISLEFFERMALEFSKIIEKKFTSELQGA